MGDGVRDFQDTVMGAGAQAHAADGGFEPAFADGVEFASQRSRQN